jgi:all-trans-retinol 13,14-reductase
MTNLKDRYDVMVIGAGIGGLTCGALLARSGLSVLVAEQGSKPGGYCTSFRRKGFTFDVGVGEILGCGKGGRVYNTLEELGLAQDIEFINLGFALNIIGADYHVRATTVEALAEELKRLFPAESASIDAFLGDCKALASEMEKLIEVVPDLMGFGGKLGLMMKFLFKSPKMKKYSSKSAGEVFNAFFTEPRLRTVFGTTLPFEPGVMAPLIMAVLGGEAVAYYPKGGAQAVADVFAKGLVEHGGDLALKTMVTRILIEDGRATGVELADGTQIKSRHVVSNVDGRETFLKLAGEEHLTPRFVRELKEARLWGSFFTVSLGVDLDLTALGFDGTTVTYNRSDDLNEIFSADPEKCILYIYMHSLRDPSQAPEGMATVQLVAMLPYDYMGNWKMEKDGTRGKEYQELKEAVAAKLIAWAENIIPGLSQHIVCKDIATPLTYERFTVNSQGAAGWFPVPGGKMRSQKSPIKNLYQAGQWTSPGPTVRQVTLSGRNAAQLVLREAKSA